MHLFIFFFFSLHSRAFFLHGGECCAGDYTYFAFRLLLSYGCKEEKCAGVSRAHTHGIPQKVARQYFYPSQESMLHFLTLTRLREAQPSRTNNNSSSSSTAVNRAISGSNATRHPCLAAVFVVSNERLSSEMERKSVGDEEDPYLMTSLLSSRLISYLLRSTGAPDRKNDLRMFIKVRSELTDLDGKGKCDLAPARRCRSKQTRSNLLRMAHSV